MLNNAVWVFDLDDTLYKEVDYRNSGFSFIHSQIKELYKKDVSECINKAILSGDDVLVSVCKKLNLPMSTKDSFLWMYRNHMPKIHLSDGAEELIIKLRRNLIQVAIITDGRAISQRNKLKSLGLIDIEALISEEFGDLKPQTNRFKYLMKKYNKEKKYIYIGDNPKKDFLMPKKLGWITIGIKDNGSNIHPQNLDLPEEYQPKIWVNDFKELIDLL